MTDRIMLDGINTDAAGIARLSPAYVAYYTDGDYAWSAAQVALFPHSVHVTITVKGGVAQVCDCENGDLTPAQAGAWVQARHAAGQRPTVYCSLATVPAVREATGSLVAGRDYDIWVADWTGAAHPVALPGPGAAANAAAVQYRSTDGYDESEVYDTGWPHGAVTAPVRAPVTAADLWPAGVTLQLGSQGAAVEALQYALRDCGIYGARGLAVDGSYGSQTQGAVRAYQTAEKLAVDGVAGPQVRASMVAHDYLTAAGEGR
jgi:hypothetical protein